MNVMDLHEHLLRLARDRAEEERAMTMTPDKLREKGNRWRELGQYDLADIYNQHAADLEEVERLKGALFEMTADRDSWIEQATMHSDTALSQAQRAEKAERRAERLQAQVDALMLEYCPDEMTPEQLAEWEKHQRAVPAEFKGE